MENWSSSIIHLYRRLDRASIRRHTVFIAFIHLVSVDASPVLVPVLLYPEDGWLHKLIKKPTPVVASLHKI